MGKPSTTDRVTKLTRDFMPNLIEHFDEGTRELVQTSVWLVGLAGGFLGVFVAKPEVLAATGRLATAIVASALSVIVFGVLLRLVQQIITGKERVQLHVIRMSLAAMTEEPTDPFPLSEHWTAEEIVRRLRDDLDADLYILLEKGVSVDVLRDIYVEHFNIWAKFELERKLDLADLFRAMSGEPAIDRLAQTSTLPAADPLAPIRASALNARSWNRFRNFLYWATGASFIATASLIAVALLM